MMGFRPKTLLRHIERACVLAACVALSSAGCAQMNSPIQPTESLPTTPTRYTNSDGSVVDKPLFEVLGWMWHAFWHDLPPPPSTHLQGYRFPVVRNAEGVAPAQPGELSVTWIGHATALIRINGATVLTDPHFSDRASPLAWVGPVRRAALPYQLSELPHIDAVVISHNHYDHLDEASVRALNAQPGGPPQFLVPAGLTPWFRARGISPVKSLRWWETHHMGVLDIIAVPAHHWSGRGLSDRNATHWAGWVVRSAGISAYYAGDTAYSRDFSEIGYRLGPFDLALIPVGAYAPRDFMRDQHVDPAEAARIHQDVGARVSVGVHWGTFELADEPLDAPLTDVARAREQAKLPAEALIMLRHGETLTVVPARDPPHSPSIRE
jgi:L-ascorbate metabolism protein UlaG (beta-lactamase superfamily)